MSNQENEEYSLYFDGCSKGNPGSAGAGFVIYQGTREIVSKSEFIGDNETNNVAEYHALVIGLKKALSYGIRRLTVYGDSLLVIKQVTGRYKVNSHNLKQYYDYAIELAKQFELIRFEHVLREKNKRADELANRSLSSTSTF